MDFTREPIIETIITPREGFRLVVRSSKSAGQEEHFVEAVEVVCFGNAFFFRSTERPKPFIVPVGDYEVLEVREPRMVLKTQSLSGSVKIATGREGHYKQPREPREQREPREPREPREREREKEGERKEAAPFAESERFITPEVQKEAEPRDSRAEKRRDRRRGLRRRRGVREEGLAEEQRAFHEAIEAGRPEYIEGEMAETYAHKPHSQVQEGEIPPHQLAEEPLGQTTLFRSILPPPATLIRDDLQRLRDSEVYRGAFFLREESMEDQDDDDSSLESVHSDRATSQEGQERDEKNRENQEASTQEEPFLFTETVENEVQSNHPKDFS